VAGLLVSFGYFDGRWIDGLGLGGPDNVGMRVSFPSLWSILGGRISWNMVSDRNLFRIVEYATREQAQQAVATLSNQNLMGRLVYVREVRISCRLSWPVIVQLTPLLPC